MLVRCSVPLLLLPCRGLWPAALQCTATTDDAGVGWQQSMLAAIVSPAGAAPLAGSVAYGNTLWDASGLDTSLQLELPPPAALLRSSLRAQQQQQQQQQQRYQGASSLASTLAGAAGPGLAPGSTLAGAASLGGSQALASDSDLLPIDAAHSFERTFRAPLSAGRARLSAQLGAGSSSGRARTPLDQSMAADSFLIYPAGRGVPRDTSRRGLGATLEVDEPSATGQEDAAAAGQPPPAGGSRRGTLGTPLHLEELYSRNEAKLKMLAAMQGGPDDKEALELFLARFVDGRMTPAAAQRPALPDVGITQQPYTSMLHTSQPGPLEMLRALPAMQPLMPLQQLVPMTPLLGSGGFSGLPAGLDYPIGQAGAGFGAYGDGFGGGFGGAGAGMGGGWGAPGRDSLALLLESLQLPGWEGASVVKVDSPSKAGRPTSGYRPISASSRLQDSEPPGLAAAAAAGTAGSFSSRPPSGRLASSRPASGAATVAGRRIRSAMTKPAGPSILDNLTRSSSNPVTAAAPEDASLMALGSRQRGSGTGGTPVQGSRAGIGRSSVAAAGVPDGAAGLAAGADVQQGYGLGLPGAGSRPGSGARLSSGGWAQEEGGHSGGGQRQRWSGGGGRGGGSQVLQVQRDGDDE